MASEEDERLELALAITKAINNEEFSSIRTFMEKFYKRSLSDKKKLNEIRLTRFNALLSKLEAEFRQLTPPDVETSFNILFCHLLKVSSFMKDKSGYSSYEERVRLIAATYYWTGQLLTRAADFKDSVRFATDLLDWLLRDSKLKVLRL